MTKNKTLILILLVSGITLLFFSTVSKEAAPEEASPEWCLVADLPRDGGSFNESGGAGEYEYQVINTESGYKVFARCAKIE